MRKSKSASGLIDAQKNSISQSTTKKSGRENIACKVNAKVAKLEPTNGKPPVAPAKTFDQSSNNKERSSIVTSSTCKIESMDAENFPSFNTPRISPLSSNGVENGVRIEERRERKPKVHFKETEPDHIDLSETQNVTETATSCTAGLLKENLQSEVKFCCKLYNKQQHIAVTRNLVAKRKPKYSGLNGNVQA